MLLPMLLTCNGVRNVIECTDKRVEVEEKQSWDHDTHYYYIEVAGQGQFKLRGRMGNDVMLFRPDEDYDFGYQWRFAHQMGHYWQIDFDHATLAGLYRTLLHAIPDEHGGLGCVFAKLLRERYVPALGFNLNNFRV